MSLLTSGSLQQNVIDAAINKMEKATDNAYVQIFAQHFEPFLWATHESTKELWTNEL